MFKKKKNDNWINQFQILCSKNIKTGKQNFSNLTQFLVQHVVFLVRRTLIFPASYFGNNMYRIYWYMDILLCMDMFLITKILDLAYVQNYMQNKSDTKLFRVYFHSLP